MSLPGLPVENSGDARRLCPPPFSRPPPALGPAKQRARPRGQRLPRSRGSCDEKAVVRAARSRKAHRTLRRDLCQTKDWSPPRISTPWLFPPLIVRRVATLRPYSVRGRAPTNQFREGEPKGSSLLALLRAEFQAKRNMRRRRVRVNRAISTVCQTLPVYPINGHRLRSVHANRASGATG